jgi:segregation and condensation protein A
MSNALALLEPETQMLESIMEPETQVLESLQISLTRPPSFKGELLTQLPLDLYIPPEALQVILDEIFEGPLDLLLYLIRKHNLDILNIPVAEVTRQYMVYVEIMRTVNLELAADYLEMAALLTEIKSRMLLPRPAELVAEEADPRAELVRRLQEYERFKKAAEALEQHPRQGRDWFIASAGLPALSQHKLHPEVSLEEVWLALNAVYKRADLKTVHTIQREGLSVRERMSTILEKLDSEKFCEFLIFFEVSEGRLGLIVTFLAVLELVKESLIELVQSDMYERIYIRALPC